MGLRVGDAPSFAERLLAATRRLRVVAQGLRRDARQLLDLRGQLERHAVHLVDEQV